MSLTLGMTNYYLARCGGYRLLRISVLALFGLAFVSVIYEDLAQIILMVALAYAVLVPAIAFMQLTTTEQVLPLRGVTVLRYRHNVSLLHVLIIGAVALLGFDIGEWFTGHFAEAVELSSAKRWSLLGALAVHTLVYTACHRFYLSPRPWVALLALLVYGGAGVVCILAVVWLLDVQGLTALHGFGLCMAGAVLAYVGGGLAARLGVTSEQRQTPKVFTTAELEARQDGRVLVNAPLLGRLWQWGPCLRIPWRLRLPLATVYGSIGMWMLAVCMVSAAGVFTVLFAESGLLANEMVLFYCFICMTVPCLGKQLGIGIYSITGDVLMRAYGRRWMLCAAAVPILLATAVALLVTCVGHSWSNKRVDDRFTFLRTRPAAAPQLAYYASTFGFDQERIRIKENGKLWTVNEWDARQWPEGGAVPSVTPAFLDKQLQCALAQEAGLHVSEALLRTESGDLDMQGLQQRVIAVQQVYVQVAALGMFALLCFGLWYIQGHSRSRLPMAERYPQLPLYVLLAGAAMLGWLTWRPLPLIIVPAGQPFPAVEFTLAGRFRSLVVNNEGLVYVLLGVLSVVFLCLAYRRAKNLEVC